VSLAGNTIQFEPCISFDFLTISKQNPIETYVSSNVTKIKNNYSKYRSTRQLKLYKCIKPYSFSMLISMMDNNHLIAVKAKCTTSIAFTSTFHSIYWELHSLQIITCQAREFIPIFCSLKNRQQHSIHVDRKKCTTSKHVFPLLLNNRCVFSTQ
jgi:hypothetical protein